MNFDSITNLEIDNIETLYDDINYNNDMISVTQYFAAYVRCDAGNSGSANIRGNGYERCRQSRWYSIGNCAYNSSITAASNNFNDWADRYPLAAVCGVNQKGFICVTDCQDK